MRLYRFFHQLFFILSCVFLTSTISGSEQQTSKLYFSPDDHLAERLVALIEKEQKSIHVAVYCLSHHGIAEALIQAKKRGVDVEVIVDPFSVKARFPLVRLARSGIPVYVWNPIVDPKKGQRVPLMHDKFCVFGKTSVWTGSFNFTYEADTNNRENALFLEDPELARRFLEQFRTMKNRGCSRYEEYLAAHPKPKKSKNL